MSNIDMTNLPENVDELLGAEPEASPIERLTQDKELHAKVLKKIIDRLDFSERKMGQFYNRWRLGEKKMQAYIDLPRYEQLLKEMSATGEPPVATSITVPYTFATIWTIVTYLVHTFTGRKPMFSVGSTQDEVAQSARLMEQVLQYNTEKTRMIRHLFQLFLDGEMYGVGVVRTLWKNETKMRTVWKDVSPLGAAAPGLTPQRMKVRERKNTYQGNSVTSIDPFMFFPDPRVPMAEVNRRGEFVFWRSFDGAHTLRKAETQGELSNVTKALASSLPKGNSQVNGASNRGLTAEGDSHAGETRSQARPLETDFYQIDQGTVELVPTDWGLGDSTEVEKWIFTVVNKEVIVQAEPLMLDHDMHPVAVSEPYSSGYGFGQVGLTDMLGPLQDSISWFMNSHVHNVRSVLNNMMVVNPSMIEMQDILNPKPGKVIRLKPSAYGADVRTALQQLQVGDITRGHVNDMREFMRMGDSLSAINDNLRGIQEAGGRKTATEVRTSGESGASRMASHAKLISAQAIVDLTEQMCLNNQQNLDEEFYIQVVGQQGQMTSLRVNPEQLVGDFYYPVHDGTLPIDRVAILDVWREILMGVMADPQLRASYDVNRLFEWVAELGGAQNINQFRVVPQGMMPGMEQQVQAGDMVPLDMMAAALGGMG